MLSRFVAVCVSLTLKVSHCCRRRRVSADEIRRRHLLGGASSIRLLLYSSVGLKSAAQVATKSLLTKRLTAHAADDVGAALGVLDVQNSLVGVVAPLLGGALLGAVGSDGTPQAAVCLHVVMGLVLVALLPRLRDAETKPKEE